MQSGIDLGRRPTRSKNAPVGAEPPEHGETIDFKIKSSRRIPVSLVMESCDSEPNGGWRELKGAAAFGGFLCRLPRSEAANRIHQGNLAKPTNAFRA